MLIGLWFLLPRVRRGLAQQEPVALLSLRSAQVALVASAIFVVALFFANGAYQVKAPMVIGLAMVPLNWIQDIRPMSKSIY